MSERVSGREVWIVLIADRHTDVEPVVFSAKKLAMKFAWSVVDDYRAGGYDISQYGDDVLGGWSCGGEGDYVSIQAVRIDDAPEVPALPPTAP